MSAHIMARKYRAKQGVSTGKDFSTYGVKRIHYYTGASGVTKTTKCVESIGTTPLLAAKTTYGLLSNRIHFPTQLCEDGTCAKYNWVKSFNPEEHAQSNYIHKIKVAAACNNDVVYDSGTVNCNTDCKETYMIEEKECLTHTITKTLHLEHLILVNIQVLMFIKINVCQLLHVRPLFHLL